MSSTSPSPSSILHPVRLMGMEESLHASRITLDSDLRLQSKPLIYWGFLVVLGQSFTGIFT